MMTRHTTADVVVLALIGERGREAGEFLAESLGPEGLRKAVVILATSDCASVMRRQAAEVAHLVAEYFRDMGKDVLLLCDSLTRIAHAQREIGLATGEHPPIRVIRPPSSVISQNSSREVGPVMVRARLPAFIPCFLSMKRGWTLSSRWLVRHLTDR